jgi:hypothetical protein
VVHAAFRNMTMLARLAGEEAFQAERPGLVAADDDDRGFDGDFPSSRAVHTRPSPSKP